MQDPGDETTFDPAEAMVDELQEAAVAAHEALVEEEGEEAPFVQSSSAPEVLTLIELEKQLSRMEMIGSDPRVTDVAKHEVADDTLQGVVMILGMSFSGDVQMLALALLQRYREMKGLRDG